MGEPEGTVSRSRSPAAAPGGSRTPTGRPGPSARGGNAVAGSGCTTPAAMRSAWASSSSSSFISTSASVASSVTVSVTSSRVVSLRPSRRRSTAHDQSMCSTPPPLSP